MRSSFRSATDHIRLQNSAPFPETASRQVRSTPVRRRCQYSTKQCHSNCMRPSKCGIGGDVSAVLPCSAIVM